MKNILRKVLKISLIIIAIAIFLSIFSVILYRFINPPITPLMVIRAISDKNGIHKEWMPIEDISTNVLVAFIASEDNLFLEHNGFDVKAIKEAKKYNEKMQAKNKKKRRGASTISQQTAKNVFLFPQRSYLRKGLEVYFTFLIETFWSKSRIIEVYANVAEMGKGIYGIEEAAQTYYKKPAKKLTASQAAMITACLPNPRGRNPNNATPYLYGRQAKIMNLMNKMDVKAIEGLKK